MSCTVDRHSLWRCSRCCIFSTCAVSEAQHPKTGSVGTLKCSHLQPVFSYTFVTSAFVALTQLYAHTHPQTHTLSLSWQCSEQSLSVLLTVIFPDECLFVSSVSPHTLPTEARSWCTFWHTSSHPTIHPHVRPSTHLSLPSLLSTLFTLYTLFCVTLQCKSHLWSFAAAFQTKT